MPQYLPHVRAVSRLFAMVAGSGGCRPATCYTEGRPILLQSESFDLGQITTMEVKASAGKMMPDNMNGA